MFIFKFLFMNKLSYMQRFKFAKLIWYQLQISEKLPGVGTTDKTGNDSWRAYCRKNTVSAARWPLAEKKNSVIHFHLSGKTSTQTICKDGFPTESTRINKHKSPLILLRNKWTNGVWGKKYKISLTWLLQGGAALQCLPSPQIRPILGLV